MTIRIEKSDIRVSVMGDIVQTAANKTLFESGEIVELLGKEISTLLTSSDVLAFNLEAPLTDAKEPIYKPGAPCISSSLPSINFFKNLRTATSAEIFISAANNHIKDFGIKGIKDTEYALQQETIPLIGVSSVNANCAKEGLSIITPKYSIGFYSCAENEFSIADDTEGGANGYDPLNTFDDIKELSQKNLYTVVLFHAGRENYRYPSINLQKICRKMVEVGANIVICQHSHCIGCEEKYLSGTILYGQGNFVFDRVNREEWKTGLIVNVSFSESSYSIQYFPIEKKDEKVRLASLEKKQEILDQFEKRGKEVNDKAALEKHWTNFCLNNIDAYSLDGVYGIYNKYVRALDKRFGHRVARWLLRNRYHNTLLLNFIRCESIREAMLTVLEKSNFK